MGSVDGRVAPGFEAVADAFERNFTDLADLGAAFAVVRDGELVVDLWGGVADPATGRPWERDTTQLIFSGTKALVATCVLMLVDRGQLDPDAPVATYWPEFGAHGKERITVAELMSHRARLPGFRARVTVDDLRDPVRLAALLADQPPEDDPRADFIYHTVTFGWLAGELVRRIDGRSVGQFFAEEVATPLDLELWIGQPPVYAARAATVTYAPTWGDDPAPTGDDLFDRIQRNPPLFDPGDLIWNRPELRRAEIPGAGAIGTARSVARFFGCLARGGELDGVHLMSSSTLERGRRELVRAVEPQSERQLAYGLGYLLQTDAMILGPPRDAFGHGGAGGSRHGAWPSRRVGFSYAMNELRGDWPEPRSIALLAALHDAA